MKLLTLVFLLIHTPVFSELLKPNTQIVIGLTGIPRTEAELIEGKYSIDDKGYIRMPHLEGMKIKASGIQSAALELRIANAYKKQGIYTKPVFNVTPLGIVKPLEDAVAEDFVYIGGNVRKEAKYIFIKGMTFADLLVEAGGVGTFGSKKKFDLRRAGKTFRYDYRKSPKFKTLLLKKGDHVEIPKSSW